MSPDVGVVIGRFQVDEIHEGHVQLLERVYRDHPNMLVLIGCRHSPPDEHNPLEYSSRNHMVRAVVPSAQIMAVFDTASDEAWSRQVDTIIQGVFPGRQATLYGGRKSFISHYSGRFPTKQLWFHQNISGSERRYDIQAKPPEDDSAFRRGAIYAITSLPPRVYMTVDIAPVRAGEDVLLVKRDIEPAWRFAGGFVDPGDNGLVEAANRELREETRLYVPDDRPNSMEFVGSRSIDDWRSRDVEGVGHKTAFFVARNPLAMYDVALAGDDVDEVQWFEIHEGLADNMVEAHRPLMHMLLKHEDKQQPWRVYCPAPTCDTVERMSDREIIFAIGRGKVNADTALQENMAHYTSTCDNCLHGAVGR